MKKYEEKVDLYFELKGTPKSTQEAYARRMRAFLTYMQKNNSSIDQMDIEDIQQYILYLKRERGLGPGTINNYISAIKFFYTYILKKEWNSIEVPRMKRVQALPVIPAKEDILVLLDSIDNLKHKSIFSLIYGSGLRVSEVARLRIRDICSKSMRIRVEKAKHNTIRYTILSETSLKILREYFKSEFKTGGYKLDDWLFPGQKAGTHIHVKSIKNTFINIRNRLELDYRLSAHNLRHCFATHSLEAGTDPVFIQQMLGHKRLQTTLFYLHITSKSLMGIHSPLDTRGDQKA